MARRKASQIQQTASISSRTVVLVFFSIILVRLSLKKRLFFNTHLLKGYRVLNLPVRVWSKSIAGGGGGCGEAGVDRVKVSRGFEKGWVIQFSATYGGWVILFYNRK